MAFKTRLLATAAIPFMAFAGYSLPASAAIIKPAAIQAQSPIVAVQSEEEEVVPRNKRRKQQEQQDGAQQDMNDPANAQAEEPVRKNRKQRQQAEEQQAQPEDNAQSDEQPVRKKRQKQAEQQQMDEAQPADNAQSDEQPVRKKRQKQAEQQQMDEAQPADNAQSDEQPVRKKRQKQAEQQQMDEAQPADNAQAEEEPVRKNRKKEQQADQGVSDEDIVNQGKRKKQAQQDGQAEEQNAADTEEPVRKNRKKQQQADDAQQVEDGQQNAKPADEVTDDDIVNKSRDRKKKREQAQDDTPEAIEKREQVAKDPSKTSDTVVLPVENGAAVLDSDKDADNGGTNRDRRKRQREQNQEVRVPKSDKDAQKTDVKIVIKPDIDVRGERIDDFRGYRRQEGKVIGKGDDVRVVFDLDGKIVIRSDDRRRLSRDGDIRYERLRNDRIKEVVVRPNGDRIVTIRNRWGEIIRRSRIDNRDVEIVIFYSPELEDGRDQLYLRDPGDELPPMRLGIPVDDYIVDVSSDPDRDYDEFLSEPPVEQVERVYSVGEVKNSARLRDKMRRIDLDTITFDTGSAEISKDQASSLRKLAKAIGDVLDRNPAETFLIEGHTDAVGSDESNLVLSDERAESIASVLSDLFQIPAENLVTQGYGERYLKIDTDEDERANRRVTIRRITPLVRPAEVSEN